MPPIPTVATSKTLGMEIARPRTICMALRISISGDKFPAGGNMYAKITNDKIGQDMVALSEKLDGVFKVAQ